MRKWLIASAWLLTILPLCQVTAESAAPLRLAYPDFNYEPFVWTDENGRGVGLFADIFQEVLQHRLNIPFTFEALPWKRAQAYVASGERDGAIMPETPERLSYAHRGEEPAAIMTMKLYAKAGSPRMEELKQVRRVADLKPFQLVDHLANGWAEANLAGMNVHWTPNLDAVLKQIAVGRGEVFVHTSQVVGTKLKKLGLTEEVVEVPGVVIEEIPFYFFISKASPAVELLPKIDRELRAMREDGTMRRLYDKYDLR
jgi:ABC-type amino acid transport substrate-binding protein